MSQKSKSRIGIGNIVSIFGLSLLGFFTFMGALMLTAGNTGAAIAIAAASVVVMSLILAAAIYCKQVDTDFSRWKKLEIAALVALVIAACFPARYVMHFFDVMGNKEELQAAAVADAGGIRSMFRTYEDGELSALAVTNTGLQNALGEQCDLNVSDYLATASINNYDDIDAWILVERRMLLGDMGVDGGLPYTSYKHNVDSVVNEWMADVKSWDLLKIGRQSKLAGELAPAVASELTKRSALGKLPVIFYDENVYTVSNPNQTVTVSAPTLSFEQKLTHTQEFNVLYLLIYIIIIALIAVQYILTPRSEKTEIGEGQNISHIEGVNRL
ncbi:MAG: hypothetical protein HDS52_04375 [Barnesiella sp.]|nr:hypothetical protein [Barnesiella sp.]